MEKQETHKLKYFMVPGINVTTKREGEWNLRNHNRHFWKTIVIIL